LWALLALTAVVGGYVVLTYNRLIALLRRTHEAWSDIQVQMKRRYDLIPNLVESVKGYAGHERSTLEAVVRARAAAVADQGSPSSQAQTEGALQSALRGLFALAENYPQLRASESFLALQKDLADTEDRIQSSRRFYNGSVRDLNTLIGQFPSNLVAGGFGFAPREFFELEAGDAAARQPVQVRFS
jgi:LemA protein